MTKLDACAPDLVLLDLMLPKKAGLEVLRHARITSDVPTILLTALGDEKDRVAGLEMGADDYVVKPFSPREVAARVKSVLRRSGGPTRLGTAIFSNIRVDFDLLCFLLGNPNRVLSRDELLQSVWDSSTEWQDPATVTVHVRRLRQKLEGRR